MTNVPPDNFLAETLVKDLGAAFGAGAARRRASRWSRPSCRPSPDPAGRRRLRALARRSHHPAPGRPPARGDARPGGRRSVRGLARGGRARTGLPIREAHARHGRPGSLPRQDRDAQSGVSALAGLCESARRGHDRLRHAHEPRERRARATACRIASRRRSRATTGSRRSGWRRGRPGRAPRFRARRSGALSTNPCARRKRRAPVFVWKAHSCRPLPAALALGHGQQGAADAAARQVPARRRAGRRTRRSSDEDPGEGADVLGHPQLAVLHDVRGEVAAHVVVVVHAPPGSTRRAAPPRALAGRGPPRRARRAAPPRRIAGFIARIVSGGSQRGGGLAALRRGAHDDEHRGGRRAATRPPPTEPQARAERIGKSAPALDARVGRRASVRRS
jgi:hypothetical protein